MAVLILGILALAELALIFALLNRILAQAGVKPIEIPKYKPQVDPPEPKETRRKVASIPIPY